MVCDQLGTVVAITGKLLHPGGGTFVSCGALRTCELCVGDVADQVVGEAQLDLTRDAGLTRASQQLLALEPEGKLLGSGTVTLAERANRAQPARAPDHSCVLQEALLLSRECVQASGDDPLHRLWHGGCDRPSLDHHAHVLLGIEGIAACAREQLILRFVFQQRRASQRADQLLRLVRRQRFQRDGERVRLAAAPASALLPQLRSGGAHHEQRN